jgi:DNA-binding transcriptional regulator YdaS (Cro superfamily)
MDIFEQICLKVGSQAALARLCNVTPQAVQKWKVGRIPAEQVQTIAAATDIRPADIRPDIFAPATH